MAGKDLHDNIKVVRSISPVAIGTTGTGQTGKVVDRAGYEGVEFLVSYGSVTATNAVATLVVKEGDVTGTMTSIADADLIGTEANAGLAAAVRASGTTKNVTKRLGYVGSKRYVQAFKLSSTISAGIPVGVDILLGFPHNAPVAT
jgi:hypothetical protein